jgi:antitoxin MazE
MQAMKKMRVRRIGGALGICFPPEFTKLAHISDNSVLDVAYEEEKIIIQKEKRPYKSIEELFEGFTGEYEPVNVNWGKPVGNEIW